MSVILFDIDGTIVTKSTKLPTSKQEAYTQAIADVYGLVNINYMDYPIFGLTDRGILYLLLRENGIETDDIRAGETEFSKQVQKIHNTTASRREQEYKALPGAFQLLTLLKEKNIITGLATGNYKSLASFKLRQAGLNHFFSFGGFGEAGIARSDIVKDAIVKSGETNLDSIVLLGDTLHDLDAARQNNIHGRAVATGRFSFTELCEYAGSPKHILENLTDLKKNIQCLLDPHIKTDTISTGNKANR